MRAGALLVHPGTLGDVVIALGPASRRSAPLWVAARGAVLRLAPWVPAVAHWLDLEGPHGPALVEGRAPEWPTPLADLGAVFVLRRDPGGVVAERLARSFPGDAVVASALPPHGCGAHQHVARLLGVPDEPMEHPWVLIADRPRARGAVAIHPGSGGRAKRWPIGAFVEVAELVSAEGQSVIWILGEPEVEDGLGPGLTGEVLRAPALEDVARLLAGVAAYLGNDSGVSHLAAAVGTPSVLVFGPTSPRSWAPAARWVAAVGGDALAPGGRWGVDPRHIAALVLAAARG